ncbi:hypothetical protein [Acinetobacter bouvetii]|nr:hypothetical protein [Acinetobacter bouvetii]
MNIRFKIEGTAEPVFVRLKDSPNTQDCFWQLSIKLDLTDHESTEKWPIA